MARTIDQAGTSGAQYSTTDRLIAVAYGILCHASFAAGIGAMMLGLYSGMAWCLGTLTGWPALVTDVALLLQFPVLHSFLLSSNGHAIVARLAPRSLGQALSTTVFATVASLQLLLTFCLWSPLGPVLWQPQGFAAVPFQIAYGLAWLLLLRTMFDAGLGVQMGYHGWLAVARGQSPGKISLPTGGTFRYVRQPVYLAFTLTLWTGPAWTIDHLLIACGWTTYCIVGPTFKERRYARFYGQAFQQYQRAVPFWMPRWNAVSTALLGTSGSTDE